MHEAAHSRNALGVRHPLVAHLRAVAGRAAEFARVFGAADLAYAAGLYHDLGKFHPDFQQYLEYCEQHPGKRGPRDSARLVGRVSSSEAFLDGMLLARSALDHGLEYLYYFPHVEPQGGRQRRALGFGPESAHSSVNHVCPQ